MNIDSIHNGVVIDHITAGMGMELYKLLDLGNLNCQVALITNAASRKMGRKDIIKIATGLDLNLDTIGYVSPNITLNIIKRGVLVEKKRLLPPTELTGVIKCKNPRCITSTEQELPHVFRLTDPDKRIYRCIYCETQAK